MLFDVSIDGVAHSLELRRVGGTWECRLDGGEIAIDAAPAGRNVVSIIIAGVSYEVKLERTPTGTYVWVGNRRYSAELSDPKSLRNRRPRAGPGTGPRKIVAPMPGKVVRILVQEKSEVDAGQGVLVVEAMKMQNEIKSPKKGIVQKLMHAVGASVNAGDVLAIIE
jgi:biotin carboxyl carrier protein